MITFVRPLDFRLRKGYMSGDKDFSRFFAYLSFFLRGMLGVVIATASFCFLSAGTGRARFLSLIVFGFTKPSAPRPRRKLSSRRASAISVFSSHLLCLRQQRDPSLLRCGKGCLEPPDFWPSVPAPPSSRSCIFSGAVGKSGNSRCTLVAGRHGRSDAVSALIPPPPWSRLASSWWARVYPLFSLGAVDGVTPSLPVVVWIGVITALMASLIAIAQADINAPPYSTVSQLA